MTRQLRQQSATGIHHVMLRGINRQTIFEDDDDYRKFVFILKDVVQPHDQLRRPLPPRCAIYSYCLMPNHVHLLIQEKADGLAAVVRDIASRFARYYNDKYGHFGHLFQDRYKSEPVNDVGYFLVLIRYIHQNPIAGGLCSDVDAYDWSSWREYIHIRHRITAICAVHSVLNRYPLHYLTEQVNHPLPETMQVLKFNQYRGSVPDEKVIDFLQSTYHIQQPREIRRYPKQQRDEILKAVMAFGANKRQLSRLTSYSPYIISLACRDMIRSKHINTME